MLVNDTIARQLNDTYHAYGLDHEFGSRPCAEHGAHDQPDAAGPSFLLEGVCSSRYESAEMHGLLRDCGLEHARLRMLDGMTHADFVTSWHPERVIILKHLILNPCCRGPGGELVQ